MHVGEILDGGLTVYRRHFGLLLQVGLVALWLPVALNVFVQVGGGQLAHPVLYVFTNVLQYFGSLVLTASAVRIISDSYLGRTPQLRDALELAVSKIWPLFVVGFGYALVVGLCAGVVGIVAAVFLPVLAKGGGGIAAVLFGVALGVGAVWLVAYVACGYGLTTQVVVLEKLGSSFDAFGRSWALTRGFKLKVLAIAVIAFIIFWIPVGVMGLIGGALASSAPLTGRVFEVVAGVLPIMMTPLLACVFTLTYYDLRVRREAFDLEVLGRQLGIS
jgi:hypothetical protein